MLLERNWLRRVLAHARGREVVGAPLMTWLYLTYRCDLFCDYCCDATGTAYPERRPGRELSLDEVTRVLSVLRRETEWLTLSGGEPYLRRDLEGVVKAAKKLGYRKVVLITNGLAMADRLDVLDHVDLLMVSLDTLSAERADAMQRRGKHVGKRVVEALEKVAEERSSRRFELVANACLTPGLLDDVEPMLEWLFARSIGFSAMPQVVGPAPHPALVGNDRYRGVLESILAHKRAGRPVIGTFGYYEALRDFADPPKAGRENGEFTPFHCLPTIIARVRPDGTLLHPCNGMDLDGGNLLELGDYQAALAEGVRRHGPWASCPGRCLEGCYLDFSYSITRPLGLVSEVFQRVRGPLGA